MASTFSRYRRCAASLLGKSLLRCATCNKVPVLTRVCALETTVGALYNSMPDIEDALHAVGWVMLNIVFPGISFGDNVIAAAS